MITEDFQYRPLNTRKPSFRLLRLLKGDKLKVECEIFHSLISEKTVLPYEALSYTWGCTDLVNCIEVNGKRLWITENLYSALHCLRYHDRDRVLWIDAVCINQTNKSEQSRQVQMMGKIFGFAKTVIFWLGKPTAEVTFLMESLSKLHTKSVTSLQKDAEVDDLVWKDLWSSYQPALKFSDRNAKSRQRQGLQQLLKRPWFERVWILQEVANAQSAIVCTGTLSIPASLFACSPVLLDVDPSPHVQSILDIMPGPTRTNSWWSRERDLMNLLTKFRDSQATDKRDMMFALLGMSSEPFNHNLLRPDYMKPLTDVIYDLVRYWFKSTAIAIHQAFDFLAGFEAVNTTYLIPSETVRRIKRRGRGWKDFLTTDWQSDNLLSNRIFEIGCIKDASLFLLEPNDGKFSNKYDSCYSELSQLKTKLDAARFENAKPDAFEIVSWRNDRQILKIVIVENTVRSLAMVGSYGCLQTFDFILEQRIKDKQKLLKNVLHEALAVHLSRHHDTKHMMPSSGLKSLVQVLLDRGVDINVKARTYHGMGLRDRYTSKAEKGKTYYCEAIQQRIYKSTALYVASECGDREVTQMLLDLGADINARGGRDGTALQAAIINYHQDVVQMLLDAGADINAKEGRYGTALQAASIIGITSVVQMLLDRGADVNAYGGPYGSALQAATINDHEAVVQMLLDAGANPQPDTLVLNVDDYDAAAA